MATAVVKDSLDSELEALFDGPTPAATSLAEHSVQPSAPANDTLDSQLEELFDAPVEAPAEPQVPKRSILDALVENKSRLSGRAAEIANDVINLQSSSERQKRDQEAQKNSMQDILVGNQSRLTGRATELANDAANLHLPVEGRASIKDAMLQRRLAKTSLVNTEREEKERAKRARNAFKIVGRDAVRRKTVEDYVDHRFTNMSLRDAVYDQARLTAIFEHSIRVDVSEIKTREMEIRSGKLGEFVLFACMVQKHGKRESKAGNKYAVWSVYNMPHGKLEGNDHVPESTLVTVLLFDEAFEAFHTQVPGGVYAFRKPKLLPPRVGEAASRKDHVTWSGYTLNVSKRRQVIPLGICKDFKLCEAIGSDMTACGAWYDANRLKACVRHTMKSRTTNLYGTRMDINNAERPTLARDVMQGVNAPVDISAADGGKSRNRYGVELMESGDGEAVRRMRAEKEKVSKLKLGLKNGGDVARSVVQMGIQAAKARDAKRWNTAGKSHGAISMMPFQKGGRLVESREQGAAGSGQGHLLQNQYEHAVAVLRKSGFVLRSDGSLVPQSKEKMKVRVICGGKTKRERSSLGDLNGEVCSSPGRAPLKAAPSTELVRKGLGPNVPRCENMSLEAGRKMARNDSGRDSSADRAKNLSKQNMNRKEFGSGVEKTMRADLSTGETAFVNGDAKREKVAQKKQSVMVDKQNLEKDSEECSMALEQLSAQKCTDVPVESKLNRAGDENVDIELSDESDDEEMND